MTAPKGTQHIVIARKDLGRGIFVKKNGTVNWGLQEALLIDPKEKTFW